MCLFIDLTPAVVKAVAFVFSFRVLLLIRILTKQNGLRFSSLGRLLPKVPETLLSCKNGFKVQLGSFSNDNENAKRATVLLSKTTTLHVHHAFLYICTTMT